MKKSQAATSCGLTLFMGLRAVVSHDQGTEKSIPEYAGQYSSFPA